MGQIDQLWTKLRPHRKQSRAWRSKNRFVALPCGRGSGKTEISRRRVVRFLPIKKPWPRPMYFYALPTYAHARRVAWEPIKDLIPPNFIDDISETRMLIKTIWGSELYVVGMDKPQRIEGDQWDGGVVDEACDHKPKSFNKSIVPALTHKKGWGWRIGVPKTEGPSGPEFKRWSESPHVACYQWDSETVLSEEDLALAKATLTAEEYDEQFKAHWQTLSSKIYYAFCEAENVQKFAEYNPHMPIVVGSDFNVNPMCWCLGHLWEDKVHIFDEIHLRGVTTEQTLTHLHQSKYGKHGAGWIFHGDATASNRTTKTVFTDYAHIVNDGRFTPKEVEYPASNPGVQQRISAVNAMFLNAAGERRCFIHPRCKHLIKDMVDSQYIPGTRIPDKRDPDIGHMADGFGYIIHWNFPIVMTINQDTPSVFVG